MFPLAARVGHRHRHRLEVLWHRIVPPGDLGALVKLLFALFFCWACVRALIRCLFLCVGVCVWCCESWLDVGMCVLTEAGRGSGGRVFAASPRSTSARGGTHLHTHHHQHTHHHKKGHAPATRTPHHCTHLDGAVRAQRHPALRLGALCVCWRGSSFVERGGLMTTTTTRKAKHVWEGDGGGGNGATHNPTQKH